MGLFQRLFSKSEKKNHSPNMVDSNESQHITDEWEKLPSYIAVSEEEYSIVSLIATAIAAGDKPDSQFVIKKIMKRNPEVVKVSLITSSLAASEVMDSQFKIKAIYQKAY
ncbi:hypothetical protein ACVRZD_04120 [Streptococcus hongkongensis]|nr:hypothetical protein NC01_01230 [Streptococcus uberis]